MNLRLFVLLFALLFIFLSSCSNDPKFIVSSTGRNIGTMCFPIKDNWITPRTSDCLDYTLEEPYLIIDYYQNDLWKPWPEVYGINGYRYNMSEYSDSIIGYAVQDLYEDSLVVKFKSIFEDYVEVREEVYNESILVPNFSYLNEKAQYRFIDIDEFTVDMMCDAKIYAYGTGMNRLMGDLYSIKCKDSSNWFFTKRRDNEPKYNPKYRIADKEIADVYDSILSAARNKFESASYKYSIIYVISNYKIIILNRKSNDIDRLVEILEKYNQ